MNVSTFLQVIYISLIKVKTPEQEWCGAYVCEFVCVSKGKFQFL